MSNRTFLIVAAVVAVLAVVVVVFHMHGGTPHSLLKSLHGR